MTEQAPAPSGTGLLRRVPPAVFPSIMGLFGLGLAWRRVSEAYAIPPSVSEIILGAASLIYLFALLAYLAKCVRRPKVVFEELRSLPGRAGVGTMILCLYLLSITLLPYSAATAAMVLKGALGAHVFLVVLLVTQFVVGPSDQRRVTPVWHLNFVGFIIGALAATGLEMYSLAFSLFLGTAIMAAVIWSISLEQMVKEDIPPPLRPLVVIHLAPVALLGLVAAALDLQAVSMGCAGVAALFVAWYVLRIFWLTKAGFSALWGAFTFPLAATASLWLAVGGIWRLPGAAALVAASVIIPIIAYKVLRLWANGLLAINTNAATA